jgi:hypothetical protein
VVRATGHQLRVFLLRHWGAPVAPEVDARPDSERQPRGEEGEADTGAPRIGVGAEALKRPQANQEDREGGDHHPDAYLPGPGNAAPLHGERRRDPVQPERRPAHREDELDRFHPDRRIARRDRARRAGVDQV